MDPVLGTNFLVLEPIPIRLVGSSFGQKNKWVREGRKTERKGKEHNKKKKPRMPPQKPSMIQSQKKMRKMEITIRSP